MCYSSYCIYVIVPLLAHVNVASTIAIQYGLAIIANRQNNRSHNDHIVTVVGCTTQKTRVCYPTMTVTMIMRIIMLDLEESILNYIELQLKTW